MVDKKYFAHPTASVEEGATIGEGTKIWHQAQVRPGAVIGKNCNIGKGVYVDTNVHIGNNCKIQNYVSIYDKAIIEDDVFIGPAVTFTNDRVPRAFKWSEDKKGKIVIKKGVSVGANATLVCDLTIGEYAMVGAGAVVTKDVPAYTLVVGNPAKAVAKIDKNGNKLK